MFSPSDTRAMFGWLPQGSTAKSGPGESSPDMQPKVVYAECPSATAILFSGLGDQLRIC